MGIVRQKQARLKRHANYHRAERWLKIFIEGSDFETQSAADVYRSSAWIERLVTTGTVTDEDAALALDATPYILRLLEQQTTREARQLLAVSMYPKESEERALIRLTMHCWWRKLSEAIGKEGLEVITARHEWVRTRKDRLKRAGSRGGAAILGMSQPTYLRKNEWWINWVARLMTDWGVWDEE